MKKLLLGLCLLGLGVACKASGATMHDSSCTGKDCTECTQERMQDCADCKAGHPCEECQKKCEGETCPVTGKSMN